MSVTDSATVHVTELDLMPFEAAARLHHLPGLVLLDSSREGGGMGRYSYVTAAPCLTIRSWDRRVEVSGAGGRRVLDANPWDVLQRELERRRRDAVPSLPPFQGGAAGYFGYDLGRHLERLLATTPNDIGLPDLHVGFYDWVLAHDHGEGRSLLISTGLPDGPPAAAAERMGVILDLLSRPPQAGEADSFTAPPRLRSNTGRDAYLRAVERIKEHIAAGDCYQVNYSHRLEYPWDGDPWALYERLREVSPVPYGAYLQLGDAAVLSASPERFLRLDGRQVETRPIKGTRPRGTTPSQDAREAATLSRSAKDRAENLMIVDLLRNDLGKVCEVGSVEVPGLFELERYSHVWQLVSTVTGRLRPDLGPLDLLRACFPGGSVTGCPKIRSMEIIEELERARRGVYCGSIGYIDFGGAMDTSIVIRTPIVKGGKLYLQVGGAVVADSDPLLEYEESLAKAAAGLAALDATVEEW